MDPQQPTTTAPEGTTHSTNKPASNPSNLHPKAIWLFFFQYLGFVVFAYYFFGGFFFSVFLVGVVALLPIPAFLKILGGIIIFILMPTLIAYFFAKLGYKNWKYELTPDALRIEKGIIWKRYVSIPYERIQNVDIFRGILARMLNLSDLHIQTAGQSSGGGFGSLTGGEGRLPGLEIQLAEQLRDQLITLAKGKKSGV